VSWGAYFRRSPCSLKSKCPEAITQLSIVQATIITSYQAGELETDVVDVGEGGVRSPVILEMSEINGAVRQQHGLLRRAEGDGVSAKGKENEKM